MPADEVEAHPRSQKHLDFEQSHHDEKARIRAVLNDGTATAEPAKKLIHEVNMLLHSVASHGPAALTDTNDPMYTARLLRRLRDALSPTPAQRLAAGEAVRAEMERNGLDANRKVYGQEITNVIAGAALDASLRAATEDAKR